jgi:hypothetical protein
VFDQSRELKSTDGKRGIEGKATIGPASGGLQRAAGTRENWNPWFIRLLLRNSNAFMRT